MGTTLRFKTLQQAYYYDRFDSKTGLCYIMTLKLTYSKMSGSPNLKNTTQLGPFSLTVSYSVVRQ